MGCSISVSELLLVDGIIKFFILAADLLSSSYVNCGEWFFTEKSPQFLLNVI